MAAKKTGGLAFADALLTGLDESSSAPPSDLWSPTNAGEWLLGEIADISERTMRGRDGDGDRSFLLYQVYGKVGDKVRDMPKTEKAIFDKKAALIPVADGRVGLRRCFAMKVDGSEPERRGAEVGDCVILRCLGKQGNAYQYGGYIWEPQVSRVPDSVLRELQQAEKRYNERKGAADGDVAADAADDSDWTGPEEADADEAAPVLNGEDDMFADLEGIEPVE